MKESYDEGLANYIGPVPCVHVREGMGEASGRGSVGWVLSRESAVRGADPVGKWGRQYGMGRHGESHGPASRGHRPHARVDTSSREPGDLSFGRRASPAGPCRESLEL